LDAEHLVVRSFGRTYWLLRAESRCDLDARHFMRHLSKKAIAIATGGVVLVVGTGVAYAYWSAGGTGNGTGATGTSTALTVDQTTVLTAMFPGDAAQTLSGTFTNASSGTVHVASVTASLFSVTDSVGGAVSVGCSVADYTLANATMAALQEVAVGTGGTWTGATVQFNNTTANQDACKGKTLNIHYAVA
jgi:hypothetical protein